MHALSSFEPVGGGQPTVSFSVYHSLCVAFRGVFFTSFKNPSLVADPCMLSVGGDGPDRIRCEIMMYGIERCN